MCDGVVVIELGGSAIPQAVPVLANDDAVRARSVRRRSACLATVRAFEAVLLLVRLPAIVEPEVARGGVQAAKLERGVETWERLGQGGQL